MSAIKKTWIKHDLIVHTSCKKIRTNANSGIIPEYELTTERILCITSWRAGIFLEECFFSHNYSSICNYYGQIPYRSLLVIREMGHGASLPQAGEEIQQTPVRSLLQVRLKNLVPDSGRPRGTSYE